MSGMGLGMQLGQKMTQSQILAPRMIQSMEILQLPIMDLQARIEQEMQKKKKDADEEPKPEEVETKKHRDEKSYDYLFHAFTLDDVARTFPEPVPPERWEEALHMVQKLDPPGIGARDLRECLLL